MRARPREENGGERILAAVLCIQYAVNAAQSVAFPLRLLAKHAEGVQLLRSALRPTRPDVVRPRPLLTIDVVRDQDFWSLKLLAAAFLEPRGDVQLNAEGNCIKDAVRTVAVVGAQIHKAREIVIESEIYPVVPGQARAPFG
jgi:hypothetical protein